MRYHWFLLFGLQACAYVLQGQSKASPLIDFEAIRGDDPKVLGLINLEGAKGQSFKENNKDVYIKLDKDWKGTPCAHFHHKTGYRRAEYHSLKGNTTAGTTYYIAYNLALEVSLPIVPKQLPDGLILFQWKEYKANNDKDQGANIPLALELRGGKLELTHTTKWKTSRQVQWSTAVEKHQPHKIGLEILAKADDGHVKLWFDGKPATFATSKSTTLTGNMFPGQSDPKFGAYGGQDVVVDTYVYEVQIGTSKDAVDASYFGS